MNLEKEKKYLTDSNRELCQTLRDEREKWGKREEVIERLKVKTRTRAIVVAVLAFLLAMSISGLFLLPRQDARYKALISDPREASLVIPEIRRPT